MLELLAAAASAEAPPAWIQWLPIIGMIVIFWFLIIRPQMKRQKEHQQKISALKKGDQVVTAGGLVGKVVKVDDTYADIELAQGVRVKAVKRTIGDIIPTGGSAALFGLDTVRDSVAIRQRQPRRLPPRGVEQAQLDPLRMRRPDRDIRPVSLQPQAEPVRAALPPAIPHAASGASRR